MPSDSWQGKAGRWKSMLRVAHLLNLSLGNSELFGEHLRMLIEADKRFGIRRPVRKLVADWARAIRAEQRGTT